MKIDVIIPTYKPGKELFTLIDRLENQTIPPTQIILMNTEEKYFENLVYGTRFPEQHKNVKVNHISKREFDHGRTRRQGVNKSDADIFIMMTQDAVPADEYLIERLTEQLTGEAAGMVAAAYARQLPNAACSAMERYTRGFNYPEQSRIKSLEDLPKLGIKTYFCSNVCAAYRRDIYEELGGFVYHTIFNEDMIYAAGAMKAGYKIAYAAQAQVIHSHNYTNQQQFHRNFDLGVSQAEHPEVFGNVTSESEGKKMVLKTAGFLVRNGMAAKVPYLFLQTVCKYTGYLLGKHYKSLPHSWVVAFSDNKDYWR